jgi:hypothetical protein
MSRSHFPEQEAITIQLFAALRQYGDDVAKLAREWRDSPDMEHYARVSRQVDEIKKLCAGRRELAVQWVTVLISHTELMHALWRASYGKRPGVANDVEEHLRSHCDCIASLRARCKRLLAEQARGMMQ